MRSTRERGESGVGLLSILLGLALLAVVVVAIMIVQSGTTSGAPYGWGLIAGALLALIVVVAVIVVASETPATIWLSSSIEGDRTQHRDTTGRFAAGSMGTLKTGQEGGTAIPEGVGSSAPGGASSPGDKAPAA